MGLGSSAIGALVERRTRLTMLLRLPPMEGHGGPRAKNGPALAGHGAEAVRDAIASMITTLPGQLRRSLTWDQGAEMAQHAQLRTGTGLEIYFCNPTHPGSAARTRTPTGSCASTSPRERTSAGTTPTNSPPLLPRSTAVLAKHSDGGLQQKPSMLSYTRPISINAMLRRPVESAQSADQTVVRRNASVCPAGYR